MPRKTTNIFTRRKTKTRTSKNPRRKWEKSEYMNALKCLLRAEEKGVKKEIGKIVHDLWIEKGMWENDEKNLMYQERMIKSKGWVTNIEIETIRRKIENDGRDEMKVQYKKVITQRIFMMKMLISTMQIVRMKNPLE